jgi:hypothetical protein
MNKSRDLRALLLAYLLDELPAEERRSTEERMLIDQNFSDELQEVEFDLIDDFHARSLSSADRRRVEKALLADRLALPVGTTPRVRHTAYPPARRTWLMVAAGAVAVLLVLVWSFARRLPLSHRSQPALLRAGVPSTPGSTASNESDGAGDSMTAVLLLTPDVSRGADGAELRLLPSTRSVLVQWVLPAQTSSGPFILTVNQRAANAVTVPQEGSLRTVDGQRLAIFHVSRSAFPKGPASMPLLLTIRKEAPPNGLQGEFQVRLSLK